MDPFSRFLSTVVLLACGREDGPACLGPCDSVGRRCDTADQLLVMIHQEAEWEREAYQHTKQLTAPPIPHGACQDPGNRLNGALLSSTVFHIHLINVSLEHSIMEEGVPAGHLAFGGEITLTDVKSPTRGSRCFLWQSGA